MKFDVAHDRWMQHLESHGRAMKTRYGYSRDLNSFRNYFESRYNTSWYVEDTSPEDIEDFLEELHMVKNLQPASRNRVLNGLRSFYKYLHNRSMCPSNPTISVETIRYRRRERPHLTPAQYEEFIARVRDPVIKMATETLWYAGLRISELCTLSVKDVSFEENLIHVVGKGGYDRDVPMHRELRLKLQAYVRNQGRLRDPWERFFALPRTGALSPSYFNYVMHKTTKELGWEPWVTAHTFRHSFATNLMNAGIPMPVIQRLLGHKHIDTTMIYTHADIQAMKEAVGIL